MSRSVVSTRFSAQLRSASRPNRRISSTMRSSAASASFNSPSSPPTASTIDETRFRSSGCARKAAVSASSLNSAPFIPILPPNQSKPNLPCIALNRTLQAACPISILAGDYRRLESLVATLLDYSARNNLFFWRVWGHCFKGVQVIRSGRLDEGLIQLREGMEELRGIQYGVYYVVFLCEYAEALGLSGEPGQ